MGSRLSLLDVLPRSERVDIGGGQEIEVFGISTEDVGKILARFPNAFEQMVQTGGNIAAMDAALTGAVIAASQRNEAGDQSLLGVEEVERVGRTLGIGVQMKLGEAIVKCTFPDGLIPFFRLLSSMSSGAEEVTRLVVSVASKEASTSSPPRPRNSGQPDIPASGN